MPRLLTTCCALMVLLLAIPTVAGDAALAVIVHPSRATKLERDEVRRIYLRRRRFWPDGASIIPVNQPSDSVVREAFSLHVFGRPAADLITYWNERYFQGVLPPATLASDEAVKRYVAATPDAIGYIDARQVDETVAMALRLGQPGAPEASR